MDIIISILFVVFMFLVDWRLSKILEELKRMNKATVSKMEIGDLFPSQAAEPTETDVDAMAKHGIKFDGKQYVFKEYGYDKLTDAIAYAKKNAP